MMNHLNGANQNYHQKSFNFDYMNYRHAIFIIVCPITPITLFLDRIFSQNNDNHGDQKFDILLFICQY